ncbi:MAG: hypothetical protein GY794_17355 [bacterium]|nr:hypothetical protein [bacterium]
MLIPEEIAGMIDLSVVKSDCSIDELRTAADLAKKYNCICVIASPAHTPSFKKPGRNQADIGDMFAGIEQKK